ncbi:NAD(P)H-dependent oxidoreductase [Glycomyces paridis]|uniref:NAD(P)H-dependent oxidoreductase n=1 Tax=Glycomyces paridis TaxID=2126555 RepID=A0A4S8PRY5_9ACTN|nr:NAD(P)H-dependent oxidoreductase [Glycomyces paridis]THV30934.1 NAD(P)H-dependent oxidoreductase [Glycomyces paridis]
MHIHHVYAHPHADSLNAALRDETDRTLTALGHTRTLSDLYAMRWKAVADHDDFAAEPDRHFMTAAGEAYRTGALAADIRAEHERLLAADALLLQFPLWWFSMPAIMKGWFDRVFTNGFGYNTAEHYGAGVLAGKRAMLMVTTGATAETLSGRGIGGPLDDLLFPIQHGTLFYTGMRVLPPFAIHSAWAVDSPGFARETKRLRERLETLAATDPIPFRTESSGDYDAAGLLKPGAERPGTTGFAMHTA